MKNNIRYLFILMVIVACSVQFTEAGLASSEMDSATGPEQGIDDLPLAALYAASAAIGRESRAYHFSEKQNGLHGRNPAQFCDIGFSHSGVEMKDDAGRWGLSLSSWGYENTMIPVHPAVPVATGNRVEYRRGALTEWYVNGPYGLQQGFTLESRPLVGQPGDNLRLSLDLAGGLTAMVDPDRRGVSLYKDSERALARYAGLTVLDAQGREAPTWLEVEPNRLFIVVDDRNLDYPLVIDPFIQKAKLTASDGAAGDFFGYSVSSDGNTVVVGAYSDDIDPGSAYVFVKPKGGWSTTSGYAAKLTASDGAAYDYFGYCVSVSGDTVVVGAFGDDSSRGSAYVFVKPEDGWANMTQTAKLTASDGTWADSFGRSVSISGDMVVVGAYTDDDFGDASGSAYVFVRPSGGWEDMIQTAKLTASDGSQEDLFGCSVSVSGDTVLVGAFGDDSTRGSAYVFVRPGGGWVNMTQTAKLTASDGAADNFFGISVSTSGDTVVIGAVGADGWLGSAYVFVEPGLGWSTTSAYTAKLTPSDGAGGDFFSGSVSISGDTVVVGAAGDDDNGSGSGSAYVFVKPGGGWVDMTQAAKLTASEGAEGDNFGKAVSVSGDTVVVGAYGDDTSRGSAYVFEPPKKGGLSSLNLLLLLTN